MARAMWKASLQVGDLALPVALYAAVEERGVHFRLLHASDHVPVVQRMVDPASGDEVPASAVRRGLELEPGVFVTLNEADLASAEPAAARTIEVTRFVPRRAIAPGWYRRPYWLGPAGEAHDYFALARALEESARHGVARWVMRKKRYLGALAARDGRLALVALSPADEVVAAGRLPRPAGPALAKGERKLAEQLVATLDARFEPALLRDEHRERLRALVEAKAAGRSVEFAEPEPAPGPSGLADALRESLRAARKRRAA